MLKFGRYPPKKIQSSHLKSQEMKLHFKFQFSEPQNPKCKMMWGTIKDTSLQVCFSLDCKYLYSEGCNALRILKIVPPITFITVLSINSGMIILSSWILQTSLQDEHQTKTKFESSLSNKNIKINTNLQVILALEPGGCLPVSLGWVAVPEICPT